MAPGWVKAAHVLDYAIQSDGITVWIHTVAGTVARFGVFGIDVHTPDTQACLHCTHGPTSTPEAWEEFRRSVKHYYGIEVPQDVAPRRVRRC